MGGREVETLPEARVLRLLLDANVILDLMLRREPWLTQAQELINARDAGRVIGYLPSSALTDVFYIARRLVGIQQAFDVIDRCLDDFEVLPVDRSLLEAARRLPGNDFEDNVQIACATMAGPDLIVTRNRNDFTHSAIPAIEPAEISGHLT